MSFRASAHTGVGSRPSFMCPRRVTFSPWRKRVVPRPGAGHFWPGRDFPFLCLRRVTFFPWRKKVTKERHLRKGGFRFPPFLKNLFPLKRPKGRGCDPSPLETPPGVLCDYQIAPLPLRGKGRWRPLAAICKSSLAINSRVAQPCISEQKRQRKEKQRQCNI